MSENELATAAGKLRLYVDTPLGAGVSLDLTDKQSHYLVHVMRAKRGDHIRVFNGRDGEWSAHLQVIAKHRVALCCERQVAQQSDVPDFWLCFAPIKKTPADYVVQKATELGARVLQPVVTRRTIVTRLNLERMRANAIEAAEQSGRLSVPEIRPAVQFGELLARWPQERRLIFCDESGRATPIAEALRHEQSTPFAIIVGPEGGFDPTERSALGARPFVAPVSLGARILRADTAALAALAVLQALRGDWG